MLNPYVFKLWRLSIWNSVKTLSCCTKEIASAVWPTSAFSTDQPPSLEQLTVSLPMAFKESGGPLYGVNDKMASLILRAM